jgi:hypothetical protein
VAETQFLLNLPNNRLAASSRPSAFAVGTALHAPIRTFTAAPEIYRVGRKCEIHTGFQQCSPTVVPRDDQAPEIPDFPAP